jgi:hypothetical protein
MSGHSGRALFRHKPRPSLDDIPALRAWRTTAVVLSDQTKAYQSAAKSNLQCLYQEIMVSGNDRSESTLCVATDVSMLMLDDFAHMKPIDPDPYLVVYGVLVFLVPWLIYGSFIVRGLLYARSRGISLFSFTASAQIRKLRRTDNRAAFLHQRTLRWLVITLTMWVIGFAVMCLTLYLLHRRGIV